MSDPTIAVIGMAGGFPGARDLDEFWRNLCAGLDSITRGPAVADADRATGVTTVAARGRLLDSDMFDHAFFGLSAREAELVDPQHRLLLEASWTALESAGYPPNRYPGRVSVYATCNVGRHAALAAASSRSPAEEFTALVGTIDGCIATRVANRLNLRGEAITVQTACSSSLVAMFLAVQSLRTGQSDLSLVGAVNAAPDTPLEYRFQPGMIYSADGYCRPFSDAATGMVEGEGVGVIVLKRLADAQADGDRIRAIVRGVAVNNDGRDKAGFTAPSVTAQAEVIRAAMRTAGVRAAEVGFVEAHGTATALGDSVEVEALTRAYRSLGPVPSGSVRLGAVKANIGHLIQAAGIAGFIKAVLCVEQGLVPPLAHLSRPNPLIPFADTPFRVNTKLVEWTDAGRPRIAGVSSFGIGGTNAHAVILQAVGDRKATPMRGWVPVPVSAATAAALAATLQRLRDFWLGSRSDALADVAYTLATGRSQLAHRWLAWVRDMADLSTALAGGPAVGTRTGVVAAAPTGVPAAWSEIGRAWLDGADVDWAPVFDDQRRQRVSLPTYPFERVRCWPEPRGAVPAAAVPAPAPAEPANPRASASSEPPAVSPDRDLERLVLDAIAEALRMERVPLDADIFELGADSLTQMGIALECETALGVEVPLDAAFDVRTPRDLVALLESLTTATDAGNGDQAGAGDPGRRS
jgi:acyl transferase domain-containing protein